MKNERVHDGELAAVLAAAVSLERAGAATVLVKFACGCGKHLIAPLAAARKKGYCPKCRKGIAVPSLGAANILTIRCSCGKDTPPALLERSGGRCPNCLKEIEKSAPLEPAYARKVRLLVGIGVAAVLVVLILLFVA
jgi:hypothetical protein